MPQAHTRSACLVLGLAFLSGCTAVYRPPAVPSQHPEGPEDQAPAENLEVGVIHVVEPGQTLWRIAKVYGVSLDALAAANGIVDPTTLEVGRGLWVPGASEILEVVPYRGPATAAGGGLSVAAFVWPLSDGKVLAAFGESRRTHPHRGVDIGGSRGQQVVAAASGRVVYSDDRMRGYGSTVILDHGDGLQSLYAHNSKLLVHVGDHVDSGEPIALLGRTGNATGEHCHFEIRRDRVPVDPMPYLSHGPRE
jgi:murein DD-endopeptidase MepM/ murein hydrolase activator NlpD